jgi:hypothetical protein
MNFTISPNPIDILAMPNFSNFVILPNGKIRVDVSKFENRLSGFL